MRESHKGKYSCENKGSDDQVKGNTVEGVKKRCHTHTHCAGVCVMTTTHGEWEERGKVHLCCKSEATLNERWATRLLNESIMSMLIKLCAGITKSQIT